MTTQAQFAAALMELPPRARAWLEDGRIELWAYHGLGIVLNDAQLEHLDEVQRWPPGSVHVWRWANRTGKMAPIDEPVLTPDGWRPIGELAVGDRVFAGDGSVTTVTGVFPQGELPVFRVTFDDGASTRCGDEHLWTVKDPESRFRKPGLRPDSARRLAAGYGEWVVRSLADLRAAYGDAPTARQRWAIPTPPAIQFQVQTVPIDPYALGLLLGDGSLSIGTVHFTTADPELATALAAALPDAIVRWRARYDYLVTSRRRPGQRSPLISALRDLGLYGAKSAAKFVPSLYLHNAPAVRLAILQGLMDTDGSVGRSGQADFSSVSRQLAEDVIALVRSLGGKASLVARQTYFTYKGKRKAGQSSYRVTIRQSGLVPFRLERKCARLSKPPYRHRGERIVRTIEPAGTAESVCIRVAHPSQTYITRDYIVTHNTTGLDVLYGWAAWYKWRLVAGSLEDWWRRSYKVLHAAPLGELAGKAYELWEQIIAGGAEQQRNPITQRQRPALLAPFFRATKTVDATNVDRPVVECANNAAIDFRSTQGKAARLESDQWWLIGWDEFPRQQPTDDIPVIFDQTMLARSSDFLAPVILAGTATVESEYIYAELEDYAQASPADWNFTTAARTENFAATKTSIDRQVRLSINKDIANRSVGGQLGGGASSLYPTFLLDNAFTDDLPEQLPPPSDEKAWERFNALGRVHFTSLDHALAHDDNVILTVESPWPPHTISPENPIVGRHIQLIRSSRTLTGDEVHAYLSAEARAYRSKADIIDATGEGGLSVYRKALMDGLPAVDCNLQGRAAKWVTNKEFGLQGLQRLLSYGLPVSTDEGFIGEWPEASGPFGLLRFPNKGPWQKLRRQLAVMRRADEKIRQDAAMTLVQLSWYLWKLIGHAMAPRRSPFNIVAGRPRGRRRVLALGR